MLPGTCTSFGRAGSVSISGKSHCSFSSPSSPISVVSGLYLHLTTHVSAFIFRAHSITAEITVSTHIFPVSTNIKHPPQSGASATMGDPPLTCHYHTKPCFISGITLRHPRWLAVWPQFLWLASVDPVTFYYILQDWSSVGVTGY